MKETKAHEDQEVRESEKYELGYHLVPSLSEDDLALRVDELVKAIVAAGGTPISEGYPQSFALAYTMRRLRGGKWEKYDSSYFGWMRFSIPGGVLAGIRDQLDHHEHVIRYLLLKLPPAAFVAAPAPRREAPVRVEEVSTEPKALVKKQTVDEQGEVSEEELEKQIEQLIS